MTLVLTFLTILAWAGVVLSGLLVCTRLYYASQYSDIQKAYDELRGFQRTHPIAVPSTVFLLSAAFLLARWLN